MKKLKKETQQKEPVVSKQKPGFFEDILDHPYIIIIFLPLVCFGRTICFEFLNYDDQLFIVDNQKLIYDFSNLTNVFTHGIWSFIHFVSSYDYYRPFLILSLMIDAQFGGASPLVYHISNLLYHITACLLLFRLFIKLDIRNNSALLLTCIFAVHPIVTQAIAWIPGRNDTLLAIFILASFLNYINFVRSGKNRFLILHFLFFILGLLTKETAVLLPAICFYYSAFITKEKLFSKHNFVFGCLWIIIAFLYFFLRAKALGQMENEVTFPLMIQTAIYRLPAIVHYVGKMILPFNLSVKPTQQDTSLLLGIVSVIIIAVSLFLSKQKNYRKIFLGTFWILIFLIPVLALPKMFNDNIFEHRAYLPLVGMLILLYESVPFNNKFLAGTKAIFAGSAVVFLFFIISFNHAQYFKTALVFWQNAALNSPHDSEAHIKLGSQYFLQGDKVKAEVEIQKALALNPKEKRANAGLGAIYADRGEFVKAEKYYKAEIALGTNYLEDFKNLGSVLVTLKNDSDAIVCFENALRLDSNDNSVNSNLGFLYFNRQDYDGAKKVWERMLMLTPNQLKIHANLAILYSRTGDYNKAIYYANAEEKIGGKMPEGFIQAMNEQLNIHENNKRLL
ncbi:MAG: tetratricopeptide repeat protein [Bacteroidia bacterium]